MKQYYKFAGLLLSQAAFAQAPVITSLSPGRNGEATNRAANVVATFSQPLSTSVPGTALRVFSTQRGGRLAGNVLVSGNALTFDPTRDFRVGEELSVTATTGIQNNGGVALAAPQVYRFRVRQVGGIGVFGARTTVAVGGQSAFLVTADVDGDNDLDLLTANQFDNTVSVRLNNGQGVFSGGSTVVVGSAPTSVEAADVDGDGIWICYVRTRTALR